MHDPEPRQQSARMRVFETVRAQIVGLELPPGELISENDLAAKLGVSRTPVREAILLLADDGLAKVYPKIGTFVTRVDLAEVREAQFLREAVELASVRSVRFPLDADLVEQIHRNLDQQAQVASDDLPAFFKLDEAFHRSLMGLAGHAASWSTIAAAKGHLDRARVLGIKATADHSRFYRQHVALFESVLAADLATAEQMLKEHLRVIFTDLAEAEERHPQMFHESGRR